MALAWLGVIAVGGLVAAWARRHVELLNGVGRSVRNYFTAWDIDTQHGFPEIELAKIVLAVGLPLTILALLVSTVGTLVVAVVAAVIRQAKRLRRPF